MKISVIIPAYNSEKFIARCLYSVIKQSYKDFEIIVVNDGSNDNTEKEIKKIITENSKVPITYLYQNNSGVTKARATGTFQAKGEFITFVDSDDTLPINALEVLINAQKRDNSDITIGAIEKGKDCILNPKEYIKCLFREVDLMGPCAKLINRNLFNEKAFQIPRSIVKGEDFIMNILIAQNASRTITRIKNIVYNYHHDNENSALHTFKLKLCHEEEVYNCLFKLSKPEFITFIKQESIYSRFHGIEDYVIAQPRQKIEKDSPYIQNLIGDIKKYKKHQEYLMLLKKPNSYFTRLIIKIKRKLFR